MGRLLFADLRSQSDSFSFQELSRFAQKKNLSFRFRRFVGKPCSGWCGTTRTILVLSSFLPKGALEDRQLSMFKNACCLEQDSPISRQGRTTGIREICSSLDLPTIPNALTPCLHPHRRCFDLTTSRRSSNFEASQSRDGSRKTGMKAKASGLRVPRASPHAIRGRRRGRTVPTIHPSESNSLVSPGAAIGGGARGKSGNGKTGLHDLRCTGARIVEDAWLDINLDRSHRRT